MHAQAPAQPQIRIVLDALGPWGRRVLALGAGALATLAHAPFQIVPAYVVALVALVWLLDGAWLRKDRLKTAFMLGWLFGLGHYLTALHWIASPFMVDPQAYGLLWAIPAALLFCGGLALFWGGACFIAVLLWTGDPRRIAALALAVLASEWLRGHLFGGLPWILPAYVWAPGEPVSQLAALMGAYALSGLTILVCAAPAVLADRGQSLGRRFVPVILAGLALGAAWGWGAQRLAHAPTGPEPDAPVIEVADTGLSQAEKWEQRSDQEWRILAAYLAASGPRESGEPTILIWPEGAVPVVNFFPLENERFLEALGTGLGDRALVMGVTRRDWRDGEVVVHNSAVVADGVAGSLRIGQIYDKYRLVPFGEFIPLWSFFSGMNVAPLQRIGAGFTPGPRPARIVVPDAPPAVVLICYEGIFPGLTPSGGARPGWLINVSNDSWFGAGIGPEQHFASTRYRAIEEGLPLARSASGGVSAIVDATGRVVQALRGRGAVAAKLPRALPPTLYSSERFLLTIALTGVIAGLRFAPFAGRQSTTGRKA